MFLSDFEFLRSGIIIRILKKKLFGEQRASTGDQVGNASRNSYPMQAVLNAGCDGDLITSQ